MAGLMACCLSSFPAGCLAGLALWLAGWMVELMGGCPVTRLASPVDRVPPQTA